MSVDALISVHGNLISDKHALYQGFFQLFSLEVTMVNHPPPSNSILCVLLGYTNHPHVFLNYIHIRPLWFSSRPLLSTLQPQVIHLI